MPRLNISANSGTRVTMDGKELLTFGGCAYLGLSYHPEIHAEIVRHLSIYGVSTTASRETTGNTVVHDALEIEIAGFLGQDAALLLTEGYTANFAMAQGIAERCKVAVLDSKSHRSISHACAGAGLRVELFDHLDASHAAAQARKFSGDGVSIISDGVFAADGSVAPVDQLMAALPEDDRAILVIDDCHGLGVLGRGGRGTPSHFGLERHPRLLYTGTLGKGLGCYGGFVSGSRAMVDQCRAAGGVYKGTTPVPPALAAGSRKAIAMLKSHPEMVERLSANTQRMRGWLMKLGIPQSDIPVPIFTFWFTPEAKLETIYRSLLERGLLVPLIDYPGGPTDRYFRLSVTALHSFDEIDRLGAALVELLAGFDVRR
jgi:8-amino-7-oxononanoate synthase